jgi:hypothetical protein
LSATTNLSGVRIGSVDVGVPVLPHEEERFPYRRDDVSGPQCAGFCVGRRLDLLKVDVLKSSPFEGHATKEELAPAEVVLFVDKLVVVGGIFEVTTVIFGAKIALFRAKIDDGRGCRVTLGPCEQNRLFEPLNDDQQS